MNSMDFFKNNKVFVLIISIIWISFIALTIGASLSVKSAFSIEKDAEAISSIKIPTIQRREIALGAPDYSKIVSSHLIKERVIVENKDKGILIAAKNILDYDEWKTQLTESLNSSEADNWRIETMCLGECPSGHSYQALIVGSKIEVTTSVE